MKNIFFPTDFSEAANRAFVYALHIADKWNATITTYHVFKGIDPEVATHMPVTMHRIYEMIESDEFENYRDAVPPLREMAEAQGLEHVKVQHVMEKSGKVIPAILERAKIENADFIVMGTTGARGLKEIFLGSVAGEILENAHCPALAVPERADFDGRINHIAFTTTYEEEEKAALEQVRAFAAPFGARVHVINVDTGHTHFYHHRMDKLMEEYKGQPSLSFQVLDGVDIFEEITDFLEEYRIDILAMVTHKRNFVEELFHYSKAKKLSYHADTPILSYPADTL
jgi:nucleotide-binding universal stress UspA family protein